MRLSYVYRSAVSQAGEKSKESSACIDSYHRLNLASLIVTILIMKKDSGCFGEGSIAFFITVLRIQEFITTREEATP